MAADIERAIVAWKDKRPGEFTALPATLQN
jgi:hypothetical protein